MEEVRTCEAEQLKNGDIMGISSWDGRRMMYTVDGCEIPHHLGWLQHVETLETMG